MHAEGIQYMILFFEKTKGLWLCAIISFLYIMLAAIVEKKERNDIESQYDRNFSWDTTAKKRKERFFGKKK